MSAAVKSQLDITVEHVSGGAHKCMPRTTLTAVGCVVTKSGGGEEGVRLADKTGDGDDAIAVDDATCEGDFIAPRPARLFIF